FGAFLLILNFCLVTVSRTGLGCPSVPGENVSFTVDASKVHLLFGGSTARKVDVKPIFFVPLTLLSPLVVNSVGHGKPELTIVTGPVADVLQAPSGVTLSPVELSSVTLPWIFATSLSVSVPISSFLSHSRLPATVSKIRSELNALIFEPGASTPAL